MRQRLTWALLMRPEDEDDVTSSKALVSTSFLLLLVRHLLLLAWHLALKLRQSTFSLCITKLTSQLCQSCFPRLLQMHVAWLKRPALGWQSFQLRESEFCMRLKLRKVHKARKDREACAHVRTSKS